MQASEQYTTDAELAFEEHYTPRELGERWKVSPDTVNRWFHDEPGVLKICTPRRKRVELRIPASVAARVYRERSR